MTPLEQMESKIWDGIGGVCEYDHRDNTDYNLEETRIEQLFKKDLFHCYQLESNPKKEIAYTLAWKERGDGGFNDVLPYFNMLASVMKKDNE